MLYYVSTERSVGVDDAEGTPVPIPNTEVKLGGAEDTWLVTAWKNKETPTFREISLRISQIVGIDDAGGTPVPIPNTEVKTGSAEDTWLVTAWKNKEMPTFKATISVWLLFLCLCVFIQD